MKRLIVFILLCIYSPCLAGSTNHVNIAFIESSGTTVSDDFESYADGADLGAQTNWTTRSAGLGDCKISDITTSKVLTADNDGTHAKCAAIFSGQALGSIKQYVVIEINDYYSPALDDLGVFLRATSDGSGNAYHVAYDGSGSEYSFFVMDANGSWGGEQDTVSATAPNDGDFIGIAVDDSTGTSATISIWDFGGTDPGGGPSTWGAADYTMDATGFNPVVDTGNYIGVYIYGTASDVEKIESWRGGDW